MPYDLDHVLTQMVARHASDLHLKARNPVYFRVLDQLERTDLPVPTPDDLNEIASRILNLSAREYLASQFHADGIYHSPAAGSRFRASVFRQRGSLGVIMRQLPDAPPSLADLKLPAIGHELLQKRRGLVLINGPASSGKSTTIASLLNSWNETIEAHVITLEDPVEYTLASRKCVITQRQVGLDTPTFAAGLRQALRQDPDVVVVGDLRDVETLKIVMAAAQRDHLVIASTYSSTAFSTIENLVGMYPVGHQEQLRAELAVALQLLLCQVLLPSADRTRRIPAYEIMNPTHGMRNLIRQNQTFRLQGALDTAPTCCTLGRSLQQLVKDGAVTAEEANRYLAPG